MVLASTAGSAPQRRRWLTVAEVAEQLGLSGPTVYRAIRAGEFPAIKVRGRYVIPSRAIDELEASAIATGLVDAAEVSNAPGQPWARRDVG